MSETKTVVFNCAENLLKDFDRITRDAGIKDRTAALHEAMRLLITKLKEA